LGRNGAVGTVSRALATLKLTPSDITRKREITSPPKTGKSGDPQH